MTQRGRWGRAIHSHPPMRRTADGDWLASARIIATLLEVSETTIRRKLAPVERDEATGALLYSAAAANDLWPARHAPKLALDKG